MNDIHASGDCGRLPNGRALGRAVREICGRRNISQEQLGFRSGLHRNYVGAVERGENNPTLATQCKLAFGLDVPLSELIGIAERQAVTLDTVST